MSNEITKLTKLTPAAIAKRYGISYPAAVRLQKELQDYTKKSIRKDITAMLQSQDFDSQNQARRHRITLDRLANYNAENVAHLLEIKDKLKEINANTATAVTYVSIAAIGAAGTLIAFLVFTLLP